MGKVFSTEELVAIGDLCEKHNIIIVSDESTTAFTTPLSPASPPSPQRWPRALLQSAPQARTSTAPDGALAGCSVPSISSNTSPQLTREYVLRCKPFARGCSGGIRESRGRRFLEQKPRKHAKQSQEIRCRADRIGDTRKHPIFSIALRDHSRIHTYI